MEILPPAYIIAGDALRAPDCDKTTVTFALKVDMFDITIDLDQIEVDIAQVRQDLIERAISFIKAAPILSREEIEKYMKRLYRNAEALK